MRNERVLPMEGDEIEDLTLPKLVLSLRKDLRDAAHKLTYREVRYIIDEYYTVQRQRLVAGNQIKTLTKAGEPAALLQTIYDILAVIEGSIKVAADYYTDNEPTGMGRWS